MLGVCTGAGAGSAARTGAGCGGGVEAGICAAGAGAGVCATGAALEGPGFTGAEVGGGVGRLGPGALEGGPLAGLFGAGDGTPLGAGAGTASGTGALGSFDGGVGGGV